MESSVQRLINNLKTIGNLQEVREFIYPDENGLNWLGIDEIKDYGNSDLRNLLKEIETDLDEWLISDNGHHHYPNRETLTRFGFGFAPGESDSFGPLTSVLIVPCTFEEIKNFRIVYG